jgi:hypothetical protein
MQIELADVLAPSRHKHELSVWKGFGRNLRIGVLRDLTILTVQRLYELATMRRHQDRHDLLQLGLRHALLGEALEEAGRAPRRVEREKAAQLGDAEVAHRAHGLLLLISLLSCCCGAAALKCVSIRHPSSDKAVLGSRDFLLQQGRFSASGLRGKNRTGGQCSELRLGQQNRSPCGAGGPERARNRLLFFSF